MQAAKARDEPRHAWHVGDARDGLRLFLMGEHRARAAYLDPPFLTGKDFGAYNDSLSREEWLALMRETLSLCRDALTVDGSAYLHVDHRVSAHARLLLDEVFGEDHFMNEIIWAYQSGGRAKAHYSRKHDSIFLYRKGRKALFRPEKVSTVRALARNNHMRRGMDEQGRTFSSMRSAGKEYRYYDDDLVPPGDVWTDISHLQQRDPERTGYPTQKPLKLLERILLASSEEGDWVLDPFAGSGTTLAAAHVLARRCFGADMAPEALSAVKKRLPEGSLAIWNTGDDVRFP